MNGNCFKKGVGMTGWGEGGKRGWKEGRVEGKYSLICLFVFLAFKMPTSSIFLNPSDVKG
jgi:hypothetical protein